MGLSLLQMLLFRKQHRIKIKVSADRREDAMKLELALVFPLIHPRSFTGEFCQDNM